jgi:hypothetical protein
VEVWLAGSGIVGRDGINPKLYLFSENESFWVFSNREMGCPHSLLSAG